MNRLFSLIIIALVFSGCGTDSRAKNSPSTGKIDLSAALDGTYTAESSRDDKLGYSRLTLKIENHKITEAEFEGVDLFGNVKDENYGSLLSAGDYKKAQTAVKGIRSYPKQLVETQDLSKVDAISGASVSYGQFVETARRALSEAAR